MTANLVSHNLTEEVLQYYSNEWVAFFVKLLESGYSVTYEYGVLKITGHNTEMLVTLDKGRWTMHLISWYASTKRKSRYDDQIREQILLWLNTAKQNALFQRNLIGGGKKA